MTCPSCTASRETQGRWPEFNTPKCIWCTARLIQTIGTKNHRPRDEITARKRAVLADAVEWGHEEKAIRALAALKVPALEPLAEKTRLK